MGLKKYDEEEVKAKEEEIEAKLIQEDQDEEDEIIEEPLTEEVIEPDSDEAIVLDNIKNKINEERKKYLDYYNKQKLMRRISTIIIVLILIGAFAMVLCSDLMGGVGVYVGFPLAILAIIAAYVVSKISRNKLSNEAQKCMANLYSISNQYIFDGINLADYDFNISKQLEMSNFINCHFYKNIKNTRSRNFVSFLYKGYEFTACDLAASVIIKNKTSPMFLGKFYSYTFSKYQKEEGVITFQLKGKELSRPLDDIDDLKLQEETKKYVIYSNDEEYKKILKDSIIKNLCQFRIDNTLIDVIVSIRPSHIDIGIDYSDEFMNVPVESEFNIEDLKRAKRDFNKVINIIELINKN